MYKINTNKSEGYVTHYIMEETGVSFCMLSYYEKEKHIMTLSNLNIIDGFRKIGLGNEILNHAIDFAKSHGCEYLYLYTTDKDSWITKWYKRKGFISYKEENNECYLYLKIK